MNNNKLNIAVVGAGIVGVSAAEWLRRDGHAVTLIDRQEPGEGTSFGNAGVLASCAVVPVPVPGLFLKAPQMIFHPDGPLFVRWSYLPKMIPWLLRFMGSGNLPQVQRTAASLGFLLGDSVEQHQALASGTPAERWISSGHYMYLYRDRKAYEGDKLGWSLRAEQGMQHEVLERADLEAVDPNISARYQLACRMENHGHIKDPGRYVKDLAAWFVDQGGKLLQAEVRDIQPTENGARVDCDSGPVSVDRVVVASGIWSDRLVRGLGHKTMMEAERGYHVEYSEPSIWPDCPYMVADAKFVLTPMDGRLRAAGLVEFGGTELPASTAPGKLIDRAVRRLYPNLEFKQRSEWLGFRPSTVDSLPLLGCSPKHQSIYFAFGHQHIGLTAGPKSGRLIADMIGGRSTNFNLQPFSVGRFD